jgi:pyruvate,water dikinase
MPGPLARLMDIVVTVLSLLDRQPTLEPDVSVTPIDGARNATSEPVITGQGVGRATVTGRARVVVDEVDALGRMEPGDVLVAPFTVPTYNAVLALAAAVVVEEGGPLCHAAVIARELGIAGLIGAAGACRHVPDGALVEIDPGRGTLRVLEATG